MTEFQRLFLVQARTDLVVFELLRKDKDLPPCHALHYLQMATELLGKAHAYRHGSPGKLSHRAFVSYLRSLSTNRRAQAQLGFAGKNESWAHLIRKSIPLAERIEDLAPSLADEKNLPNPEYPWPKDEPRIAPAEHEFEIWSDLVTTPDGRQFLSLLRQLFVIAEAYL
jgi:hypothetical protein